MQSFLDVLALSSNALLDGLMITVWVSGIAVAAGIALGAAFGLALTYGGRLGSAPVANRSGHRPGHSGARPHFRALLHAGRTGISPGPLTAGVGARRVLRCPFGETLSGALIAIPPAQTDAARAIGLSFGQILSTSSCRRRSVRSRRIRQHGGRDRQGIVAALGDRRRGAPVHDSGGGRPYLQDDGVLRAMPAASTFSSTSAIGTGGSSLERRFRLR